MSGEPTLVKALEEGGEAAKLLRRCLTSPESLAPEEVRCLVADLTQRQEELARHNEMLRQTQARLEDSRRRFAELYDAAPIGYLTLDEGGVVLEANVTAARQLGTERHLLLNRPLSQFICGDWESFYEHLRRVFAEQARQTCEVRLRARQGAEEWFQLHSISVAGDNGRQRCHTALIDIGERKRAEEKLKIYHESLAKLVEARAQGLLKTPPAPPAPEEPTRPKGVKLSELAPATSIMDTDAALIMVLDRQGGIVLFNRGLEEATGFSLEEVKGRLIWELCRDGDPTKVRTIFTDLAENRLAGDVQYRLQTKDGSHRLISWSHTFLYGHDDLVQYVVATGQEVESPAAVAPSEGWPALLGSRELFFVHDRNTGEVVDVNQAILEQHGFTSEEAGRLRQLLDYTLRDISERQRAEESLRHREQEYRRLVNAIPAVVFKGYTDWTVDFFDDKIQDVTGYRKEDFDQRRLTWKDVILPEDLPAAKASFAEARQGGHAFTGEYRIRNVAGEVRWVHVRGQIVFNPDDEVEFISGVFFDITGQKEMEARLRESEARFRNLLEYLPGVAVQGYEIDGTVRYWNRASEQLYGYAAHEAIGRTLDQLIIPPEMQAHFAQGLEMGAQAGRSGEFMPPAECSLVTKDGGRVPVYRIHTVVCLEGSPPLIFAIDVDLSERQRVEEELRNYRDHLERLVEERTAQLTEVNRQLREEITERRRTEEALRKSELRLRTIFENAPIGISFFDVVERDLAINFALQRMLGYSQEELRTMDRSRLVHPEDLPFTRSLHQELVTGLRDSYRHETRFLRQDGAWMWGFLIVSLIRGGEGEPLFIITMMEDVTQQKQVAAEIAAYQERLRCLASELSLTEERERRRLATDLHDHIGQILALAQIKLGAIRQLVGSPQAADEVSEVRDFIGQAIRYTRTLTFELSLPILYDLGFEAAVEWLAEQFQAQHGLNVEVHRDQHPKPLAEAARVLLFRTVRELMTNVVKHAQARYLRIFLMRRGEKLRLEVADDGRGFVVTKNVYEAGTGSGFGLFSIRERLSHLGGSLEIQSTPLQGTVVTVEVPLQEE